MSLNLYLEKRGGRKIYGRKVELADLLSSVNAPGAEKTGN